MWTFRVAIVFVTSTHSGKYCEYSFFVPLLSGIPFEVGFSLGVQARRTWRGYWAHI